MKTAALLLLLLNTSSTLFAQRLIRGVVLNGETGQALPFANVFLANTTKGTTTDEAGRFRLMNLAIGRYDLVVSYVGFETFSFAVQTDTARAYRILLKPKDNQLATVTVRGRRGPDWRENLRLFREQFIGQSTNAHQCRLLNPEVLWFSRDSIAVLTGGAREPLQIDNQALGYRLKYQLENFLYDPNGQYVSYLGYPVFEELKPRDAKQARQWATNRQKAYYGSPMHFMRALYRRDLQNEGFVLRQTVKDKHGLPVRLDTLRYNRLIDTTHSDAQRIRLQFKGSLQVIYPQENEDSGYLSRRFGPGSRSTSAPQTSYLHLAVPFVTVEANGNFYEPLGLVMEGYWSWEKTAELLPLDYEPQE